MAGNWATTSAFIKAMIAEMDTDIDDIEFAAPLPEQPAKEEQPRGRPQLKRENAILAENKFVENEWLEVTDSVTDSFSARNFANRMSESQWMGSSIPRKPVQARVQPRGPRPQEVVQRGLVNDWWAERLRADSVTSPKVVPVERKGLTTLKDLLAVPTTSKRELPVVSKNPEIWMTPPPEENGKAIRVLPTRRERNTSVHEEQRADTWRHGFLASLPLAGSSVERPESSRPAAFQADLRPTVNECSSESFYLVQEEDLQPSLPHGVINRNPLEPIRLEGSGIWSFLPHGVINRNPLEPIRLEGSGIWSSQLSKDLDSIETEYGWDFAPPERIPPRSPKPLNTRILTKNQRPSDSAGSSGNAISAPVPSDGRPLVPRVPLSPIHEYECAPLSPIHEYEETEEEIDELDHDIENSSAKSWDDSSSDSSDSRDSSEFSLLDENEDEYYDPAPSFTWYKDIPERPKSPTPDSEPIEDIARVPPVQQWMSERYDQHQQSLKPDVTDQPSADTVEDELVLAAYLPLSVLVSDPRYKDYESLPTPWVAQTLLIERALEPERRSSLQPPRNKNVIQKARRGSPYPTNTLVGNFYRKIMEDHADVEMADVT